MLYCTAAPWQRNSPSSWYSPFEPLQPVVSTTQPVETPRQLPQHIAVTRSRLAPSFRRSLLLRTRQRLTEFKFFTLRIERKYSVKIWDRYNEKNLYLPYAFIAENVDAGEHSRLAPTSCKIVRVHRHYSFRLTSKTFDRLLAEFLCCDPKGTLKSI